MIVLRDIDSVEFYHKENDQCALCQWALCLRICLLTVKIKSSESKEILLPVHGISEEKDGKAVHKVNVGPFLELVQRVRRLQVWAMTPLHQ